MIKMAFTSITEANLSQGLPPMFVIANNATDGWLIRGIIFMLWFLLLAGLYFAQKRSTNNGDFPASFGVAGFVTMIFATMLRFVLVSGSQLIDLWTLGTVYAVGIVGVLWFLLSRD